MFFPNPGGPPLFIPYPIAANYYGFIPAIPGMPPLCSYSDLGFLTVSSMDKIVHAASVAAARAFYFT